MPFRRLALAEKLNSQMIAYLAIFRWGLDLNSEGILKVGVQRGGLSYRIAAGRCHLSCRLGLLLCFMKNKKRCSLLQSHFEPSLCFGPVNNPSPTNWARAGFVYDYQRCQSDMDPLHQGHVSRCIRKFKFDVHLYYK